VTAARGASTLADVATFPLRTLRLLPGEEHVERLATVVDPIELGGQSYLATPAEIDAALTVQRAMSGYALVLRFETTVTGPCMRCLEDAVVALTIEAREYHDLDPGGDDELVSDYVADDAVQVGAWARDAIVLGLPGTILCRPDCAGLCPVCGRDLNTEPHTHAEEAVDPRWSALERLREP
jgi:DUF177 domain-containing protein